MGDRAMNLNVDDTVIRGTTETVSGGVILAIVIAIWRFLARLIGIPKRVEGLEKTQLVIVSSLRSLTQATMVNLTNTCQDTPDQEICRVRDSLQESYESLNDHIDQMAMRGGKK